MVSQSLKILIYTTLLNFVKKVKHVLGDYANNPQQLVKSLLMLICHPRCHTM